MAYMLLIHEPVGQRATRTEAEGRQLYQQMLDFAETLRSRGLLRAAESLSGLDAAARVQVRDRQARVMDGPFTEVKEMVGGFFLVDCATREQAVTLAAECPAAQWAMVEVRALGPCFA